jgi:hypothetical protein
MDSKGFLHFLKRGGRKTTVAERVLRLVSQFQDFLTEQPNTSLDKAKPDQLDAFTRWIEKKQNAKTYLWAIRYYYQFTKNEEMERYASQLREERIIRKPFALKDFRGVDLGHIATLKDSGIGNIHQMLDAGKTPRLRAALADETGIPANSILELVKLSDLARVPGIKSIRARLYHDAGLDSIEMIAALEPDQILEITTRFIQQTGFDGIPPLPREVQSLVKKARTLPKVVEFE